MPTSLIGLLIGVRGRTARQLEDSTGCRVEIPRKDPDSPVGLPFLICLFMFLF